MNKNISTNFLLLKDNEQKQIIQYLSRDFRRKEIYNHFLQLYKLKMQYLKKSIPVKPSPKNDDSSEKLDNSSQIFDDSLSSEKIKNVKKDLSSLKKKKNIPEIFPKKNITNNIPKNIQNFLVQEKLSSIVSGKSIALVGPANYLLNLEQGKKINNHDIIIRFNSSIIPNLQLNKFIGDRTDVWVYNFKNIDILNNLPEKLPQLLFCPYPKEIIDNYQIKDFPNCPIEFIENDFYYQLKMAMNIDANSALLIILILLRQNIKSLYVTGISFLYDGYYDAYNNQEKHQKVTTGALVISKPQRSSFMSIVKKVYNANDKLFLDNTIINLIYPNFISILNNLFKTSNHNKLFSTLNYSLYAPSFLKKYNQPSSNTKIYVHFGFTNITQNISEKFHIIIHNIKPRLFSNEIFIKNGNNDYDDLDILLKIKNKGIVYFSNNQWSAVNNMIPDKNRNYILQHHCYVNGNIYGSFIKYVSKDFDIDENDNNINMLYMLFSMIYYGQKIVYLSRQNIQENGLTEIINVMQKLNLIKYI